MPLSRKSLKMKLVKASTPVQIEVDCTDAMNTTAISSNIDLWLRYHSSTASSSKNSWSGSKATGDRAMRIGSRSFSREERVSRATSRKLEGRSKKHTGKGKKRWMYLMTQIFPKRNR